MSERIYLIIAGLYLLLILYIDIEYLIYVYVGILLFEGITNLRVPIIINRLRYGKKDQSNDNTQFKINFEAERALRLIIASVLIITYVVIPNEAWFIPWFLGVMITFAGISKFCPMVMALKWVGLK